MSGRFKYNLLFRLFASAGNLLASFVPLGKLEFSMFAFTCFIRLVGQIRIQFVHLAGQFTCFIRLAGQIIIQAVYIPWCHEKNIVFPSIHHENVR